MNAEKTITTCEEIVTLCHKLDDRFCESLTFFEITHSILSHEENETFLKKYENMIQDTKNKFGDKMLPKATNQLNRLKRNINNY